MFTIRTTLWSRTLSILWTCLAVSLTRRTLSSAMPIGSFISSMFSIDGMDDDELHDRHDFVEVGAADPSSAMTSPRDFLLDMKLYSEFNRLGETQFQILKKRGLDSPCWRRAVASVDADCQTMAPGQKQRLAVMLNNCHLQDGGRKPSQCRQTDSDAQCMQAMKHDNLAFETFTTFLHQVNAICHHLSDGAWQEATQALVQGLTASSAATFDRTVKALEKQEEVLRGQELAAEKSVDIAEGINEARIDLAGLSTSLSEELRVAMGEIEKQEAVMATLLATQAVAALQANSFASELGSAKSELASYLQTIEEDRRTTREQNSALADTIGFIHDCLENATSAWARFQAFTYMILSANLCWVVTSPPPLRSARTALFVLVAFGLLLEKYLCGDSLSSSSNPAGVVAPLPAWLMSGLGLAASGRLAVATWTKVFLQEQIRLLTLQACAVVLVHALVSYFIPCLEPARVAATMGKVSRWFCRKTIFAVGFLRSHRSKEDAYDTTEAEGSPGTTNRRGETARRRSASLQDSVDQGQDGNERTLSPGSLVCDVRNASGASGGFMRVRRLLYGSSHEVSNDDVAVCAGGGAASTQYDDGGGGGGGDGGGAGNDGQEGGAGVVSAVDDLESLSRKELQALARETDGRVKGNLSTPNMIQALREDAGTSAG